MKKKEKIQTRCGVILTASEILIFGFWFAFPVCFPFPLSRFPAATPAIYLAIDAVGIVVARCHIIQPAECILSVWCT